MSAPLAGLERALRIAVGVLAITVALLANVRAHAEGHALKWHRVAAVESVAVTVTTVTRAELLERLRAELRGLERHDIERTAGEESGFSRLYRNRDTGAYRCEVLVTADSPPAVLEHELRHCNGWVHR